MSSPVSIYDAARKTSKAPASPVTQMLMSTEAPYSQEAEEALIGAVIVNPKELNSIAGWLKPEDFYFLRHAHIWRAMLRMQERHEAIDLITLGNELSGAGKLDEIGGQAYLMQLAFNVPTSQHAKVYAGIINRAAVRRVAMQMADEMRRMAANETLSVEQMLTQADKMLTQTRQRLFKQAARRLDMGAAYDEMQARRVAPQTMGFPSGINGLDAMTGGFRRGYLYVAPAVRHMGKTKLAITVARECALNNIPTLMWNRENDEIDVHFELAGIETGVEPEKFKFGLSTEREVQRFTHAMGRLADAPLYLMNQTDMTSPRLYLETKQMVHDYGIQILIVDYAQALLTGLGDEKDASPYYRAAVAARTLFNIARDLNVAVLAMAQVHLRSEERTAGRGGKQGAVKRPQDSNILGGTDLAVQADCVFFPFRPGVYDAMIPESEVTFYVTKNKIKGQGGTGQVHAYFNLKTGRYADDMAAALG